MTSVDQSNKTLVTKDARDLELINVNPTLKNETKEAMEIYNKNIDINGSRRIHLLRDQYYLYVNNRYNCLTKKKVMDIVINYLNETDENGKSKALTIVYAYQREEMLRQLDALITLNDELKLPSLLRYSSTFRIDRMINTPCGILYIDENNNLKTYESTPDLLTLTTVPVSYNSESSTPVNFFKFLDSSQPNKDIQKFLQRWLGYNLIYSTQFQKFVILIGNGSNGKSVFLAIMKALIGEKNYSTLAITQFDNDKSYFLAETEGKLSNIHSEMEQKVAINTAVIKGFVTGEASMVARKFQAPFSLTPTARLTFSTNLKPIIHDPSKGMWRRLVMIDWKKEVAEHEKILDMDKVEFWQKSGELEGIFKWAIEGLIEALRDGDLAVPESSDKLVAEYKEESNPEHEFIKEMFEETGDLNDMIESTPIYEIFKVWMDNEGFDHKRVSQRMLINEIKRILPGVTQPKSAVELTKGRGRKRVLQGIKVKQSMQIDLDVMNI